MSNTPPPTGPASSREADYIAPTESTLAKGPGEPFRRTHPPGLYLLFVTEMWERFSYYGMRAFLTLYMIAAVNEGGLGWTKAKAGSIYGWYTALVYLTPLAGGYIADRWLGTHRSMVLGGLIIAAGHFALAFETISSFYLGLALIVVGTGFFKPCVSVMVGQLYPERDPRRDAAFTIFYMGINLGAFLGPIICGGLRMGQKQGEVFGWSWAFGAAGIGMVLGLIAYAIGRPFLLKGVGLPPVRTRSASTFTDDDVCGKCDYSLKGLPAGATCPECGTSSSQVASKRRPLTLREKHGIAAIFIMSFFVIFFWMAFEQAGSSMNFFAEERTDRSLSPELASALYRGAAEPGYPAPAWLLAAIGACITGAWIFLERKRSRAAKAQRRIAAEPPPRSRLHTAGVIAMRILGLAVGPTLLLYGVLKPTGFLREAFFPPDFLENAAYPPDWFQSVNPAFILLFAPVVASLWLRLARAGREPSTPIKFALGLILLGVGFIFMVLGAQASEGGGNIMRVSGWWLLSAYCVHTMGELCLSPVGLSMVNKLSPPRFFSLLMGVWFLSSFAANKIAGTLGGSVDQIAEKTLTIGGFVLQGQALFFSIFVVAPIGAGVVLLLMTPMLKRLMHGRA